MLECKTKKYTFLEELIAPIKRRQKRLRGEFRARSLFYFLERVLLAQIDMFMS